MQLGLSKPQCRELGIPWTRDMHTISMRPLIYSKASLPTGLIKPQRKKLGGTQMHTLKGCRFKNCTPLSSALPSLWPSFCSLQTLSTHSLQTPSACLVPCHKHLQIYMQQHHGACLLNVPSVPNGTGRQQEAPAPVPRVLRAVPY